jgi:hypothetical protein
MLHFLYYQNVPYTYQCCGVGVEAAKSGIILVEPEQQRDAALAPTAPASNQVDYQTFQKLEQFLTFLTQIYTRLNKKKSPENIDHTQKLTFAC